MKSKTRHAARPLLATLCILVGLCLIVMSSPAPVHAAEACGQPLSPIGVQTSGDESGIGGTGIHELRPDQPSAVDTSGDDSESGIGGTGIFGTVTELNRLCVNGLEIRLSQQLQSQSQQQLQQLNSQAGFDSQQLAVGQVVWIRAMESEAGFTANAIEIHPGFSGKIEEVANNGREFVVNEQVIELSAGTALGPGLPDHTLTVGQSVVVHGLRDDRNRLIASRIEMDGQPGFADGHATSAKPPAQWLAERLDRSDAPGSVSIEGYVRVDGDRIFLTNVSMEFAPAWPTPNRPALGPGSHITVEGRISPEGILRIERSRSLHQSSRPTSEKRHHPSVPDSGSVKPTRDERSPEPATPSERPRNVRAREHLPPKPRPPRLDRPELRPAPRPERPTTLDRRKR